MKPPAIEIPKSKITKPNQIVDHILPVTFVERPMTVKPDYMHAVGHPLESQGRNKLKTPPTSTTNVKMEDTLALSVNNKSVRKKKKYVEKYSEKANDNNG